MGHHAAQFRDLLTSAAFEIAGDIQWQWVRIFGGLGAPVDYPSCASYRTLAEHDPEAKVVLLTVGDAEAWYESTQKAIVAPHRTFA